MNGTGDSIYEENNLIKYKNIKPKYLQATTLDSLVLENNLLLPDIIKLDVQGAEIDVMKGGMKALSNASIVTLEMPLVQYNKGAPTFDQYLHFMRELEFYPLKIVELHPILGVLVQIDISFIRKDYLIKIYGNHERRFLL